MIRRQRLKKIPVQGQFYPMSGAAYIENINYRLTLIGRQALGVSSLSQGFCYILDIVIFDNKFIYSKRL